MRDVPSLGNRRTCLTILTGEDIKQAVGFRYPVDGFPIPKNPVLIALGRAGGLGIVSTEFQGLESVANLSDTIVSLPIMAS